MINSILRPLASLEVDGGVVRAVDSGCAVRDSGPGLQRHLGSDRCLLPRRFQQSSYGFKLRFPGSTPNSSSSKSPLQIFFPARIYRQPDGGLGILPVSRKAG